MGGPDNKGFGISGAQYTDWVQNGNIMPEFLQGSVGLENFSTERAHPRRQASKAPRGCRLASTLAAAAAAVVVNLAPAPPVAALDEGSIDAALEMDLDNPIPLSGRKCPGCVLGSPSRRASGLHHSCSGSFKLPSSWRVTLFNELSTMTSNATNTGCFFNIG